jgi:hypothetical protein
VSNPRFSQYKWIEVGTSTTKSKGVKPTNVNH